MQAQDNSEFVSRFRQALWEVRPGGPKSVEEYLDLEAKTEIDSDCLQDLVWVEVVYRKKRGDNVVLLEYQQRFPSISNALQIMWTIDEGSYLDLETDDAAIDTPADVSNQPLIPTQRRIGKYTIQEEIGHGGVGVVYKATGTHLPRPVALKVLRHGLSANAQQLARFQEEAKAAADLDHPNIVQVFDAGIDEGAPFIVMALVDGISLDQRLKSKGPLKPVEAASILKQVCEAVQYAHEHGIVHRDLKPENILLGPDGRPRVTDFGLAKRLAASDGVTTQGAIIGTPSYMPPEQARGELTTIGPASDVYSIGATMYATLVGRPPFQAADPITTISLVRTADPATLRSINPTIPVNLETICLKCLAKDSAKRYPTARELSNDLERFLRNEPVMARPAGLLEQAWRWCSRHPWIAGWSMTAAVLLITIAVGTSVAFVRERGLVVEKDQALREKGQAIRAKDTALSLKDAALKEKEDALALKTRALSVIAEQLRIYLRVMPDLIRDYRSTGDLTKIDRLKIEMEATLLEFSKLAGTEAMNDRPDLKYTVALAMNALAYAYGNDDDPKRALQLYIDATKALRELIKSSPDNDEYRLKLAEVLNERGLFAEDVGDRKLALTYQEEALDVLVQIDGTVGQQFDTLEMLGFAALNCGRQYQFLKELPKSRKFFERSRDYFTRCMEVAGPKQKYRSKVYAIESQLHYCELDVGENRLIEARKGLESILSQLDEISRLPDEKWPRDRYCEVRSRAAYNLGTLLSKQEESGDRLKNYRDALSTMEWACQNFKYLKRLKLELARYQGALLSELLRQDDLEQIKKLFPQMRQTREDLRQVSSNITLKRQRLYSLEVNLVLASYYLAEFDEGASASQRAMDAFDDLSEMEKELANYAESRSLLPNFRFISLFASGQFQAALDFSEKSAKIQQSESMQLYIAACKVAVEGDYQRAREALLKLGKANQAANLQIEAALAALALGAMPSRPDDDALAQQFDIHAQELTDTALTRLRSYLENIVKHRRNVTGATLMLFRYTFSDQCRLYGSLHNNNEFQKLQKEAQALSASLESEISERRAARSSVGGSEKPVIVDPPKVQPESFQP